MGPAAAAVHGDPSSRIPVIGVTGTNGKTTTVRLIGDLLEQLGASATEIGTLTGVRTTPEAPELQRALAEAHRQGHAAVAMEVSSHADLHRVDGTRFAVGVFTNLGVDHLDFHGDLQSYEAARRVSSRRNSPISASFRPTRRRVSGSRNRRNPDHPRRRDRSRGRLEWSDRQPFPVAGPRGIAPVGRSFNVTNAALAAEAVAALGYDDDDVAVALGRVRGVPGRFETVHAGQAFTVVIDYAHTPDGLRPCSLRPGRSPSGRSPSFSAPAAAEDQGKRPQMGRSPAASPTGSSSRATTLG